MRALLRLQIILLVTLFVVAGSAPAQTLSGAERLRLQIERAAAAARGEVGVAIKHIETGTEVVFNADTTFPMASTFTLPLLVELYAQELAGKVRFDELVDLTPHEQHLGSGDISVNFDLPGVRLSILNLRNLMMMISDNSATDILVTRVGPANVTARMRALGLNGIRVDRTCQELILDYGGQDTEKLKGMLLQEMRPLTRRGPEDDAVRIARAEKFAADPRDQATPRDMTRLLEKLFRGEVVDAEASNSILELMKRCRTGAARIKGLLPRSTVVAHKTGTIGGTVDNVGIIYLPDQAGHVVISVLTKRTRADSEDVERVIAEIARYAYDFFYFTAPVPPSTR